MKYILDNKKAVLFDLDGTLIDSMWMWRAIDIEYLARFGINIPDDLQQCLEGKSFFETAVYFKERFGIKDSTDKIMSDWNNMAFDIYKNRITLKMGVKDFLDYLKENGFKTAIATSNSRPLTEVVLNSLNISSYFDEIVTADEVTHGKPAPDIYLKAAGDLNVSPKECVVFEDIPQGIKAGKSAGCVTVAVDDEYSKKYDLEKRELSDYYINDYFDILNAN